MSRPGKKSLAYIVLRFPKGSERFIEREIRGAAERLEPVLVYSLKTGEEGLPPVDGVETVTLQGLPLLRVLNAHLSLLFSVPSIYARTLFSDVLDPLYKKLLVAKESAGLRRAVRKAAELMKAFSIAWDLKKRDLSHIHAHYANVPAEVAGIASRLTGIGFSFTAHAKDLFVAKESRLKRLVREADFVVTCTRDGKEHLERLCRRRYHRKIVCVYHGVDPSRYVSGSAGDGAGKPPLILSAGRFTEKKGFDDLIRSLSVLKAKGIPFRCVLAGGGKLEDELKGLIDRLDLGDEVELPGFLDEGDLGRLYGEAALFALPSRRLRDGNRDGVPNVILEAMASGLPVVSTRVGGIPEAVLDGESGILSGPEAADEFVEGMERLLTDGKLRRRMGKRGRSIVRERFDLGKNVDSLCRVFLERSKGYGGSRRESARGGERSGGHDVRGGLG